MDYYFYDPTDNIDNQTKNNFYISNRDSDLNFFDLSTGDNEAEFFTETIFKDDPMKKNCILSSSDIAPNSNAKNIISTKFFDCESYQDASSFVNRIAKFDEFPNNSSDLNSKNTDNSSNVEFPLIKITGKSRGAKPCSFIYEDVIENFKGIPRKYQQDGIFKKIKVHFLKYVKKILNRKLNEIASNHPYIKIYEIFNNLDNKTISTISIKSECKFINSNLLEIYKADKSKINIYLIELLYEYSDKNFKEFLISPLKEIYSNYLKTDEWKIIIEKVKYNKKNDELYTKLFTELSKIYVYYFNWTLHNERKPKQEDSDDTMDTENHVNLI